MSSNASQQLTLTYGVTEFNGGLLEGGILRPIPKGKFHSPHLETDLRPCVPPLMSH
jgi:hypothetical protein